MVCGLLPKFVATHAPSARFFVVAKTAVHKGAHPTPTQPQRRKLLSSCMNSYKQYLSNRNSKFSSNRHRKLQPFRET